jgi:DNA-binding transcriptional MerR regulator
MTVRNVRAYAERGLLPPPHRRGRTNFYDGTHLARLRLIGGLLERGYTSAHIADFVTSWESGHDIGATLGLETALLAPASGEIVEEMSWSELLAMFGGAVTDGALDRAVSLGILEPLGEDRYRVRRPRLLRAGAELVEIGMPLTQVLRVAGELRERIGAVSELFVQAVADQIVGRHDPDWVPTDAEMAAIVAVVDKLRPLARVAVDEELAAAVDDGIQRYVGEWITTLAARMPPADSE